MDFSTDLASEEWGKRDPYFAVLNDSRYRRAVLDEGARREFFATDQNHVSAYQEGYDLHARRWCRIAGADSNRVQWPRIHGFTTGVGAQ